MKLEFLPEASGNRPLIRLYHFDVIEARRLCEAFRTLSAGVVERIPLHEEWWIEPLDACSLGLRTGPRDLGVVQRLTATFDCVLTAKGWAEMADKTESLCAVEGLNGYQWLNEDGEVSLLLSPDGQW